MTIAPIAPQRGLKQNQKANGRVGFQYRDLIGVGAQHLLDHIGRAVAALNPNDPRRRIRKLAALLKIGIRGNDRKSMRERVAPNDFIGGAIKRHRLEVQ